MNNYTYEDFLKDQKTVKALPKAQGREAEKIKDTNIEAYKSKKADFAKRGETDLRERDTYAPVNAPAVGEFGFTAPPVEEFVRSDDRPSRGGRGGGRGGARGGDRGGRGGKRGGAKRGGKFNLKSDNDFPTLGGK